MRTYGTQCTILNETCPQCIENSISKVFSFSKFVSPSGGPGSNLLRPQKFSKILFFLQKFFYHFFYDFYAQIATFLPKYIFIGKKVRFQPTVE